MNYLFSQQVTAKDLDPNTEYLAIEHPEYGSLSKEQIEKIKEDRSFNLIHDFDTELEYDAFASAHPKELEEVVVAVPRTRWNLFKRLLNDLYGTGNPIWGTNRTQLYQLALRRNPNFSSDWDMWNNINEGLNAMTGGMLNRISPTLNIGLIIDLAKGKNFLLSWMGNSGIVSDNFAVNHPGWSILFNFGGDALTGIGLSKFVKWGNTPRLINQGAESEVYTAPFWNYVKKKSYITPLEMAEKSATPSFAKTEYLYPGENNTYWYKLLKVSLPKNTTKLFRKISLNYADNHYFPFEHKNMLGRGFLNLITDKVISDFGLDGLGQIGVTRLMRKPVVIDNTVETIPEFMIAMEKKGGKLNRK